MILKSRDKQLLQERGIDLGIDRGSLPSGGKSVQIRAIVKDLAPPTSGVNASTLLGILRDIRWLKKLRIYNGDVRAENFRNGQLVDFGSAVTEPHCILSAYDRRSPKEARDARLEDLVMFDDMITEEAIETDIRAMPNRDYCCKLRSWHRKPTDQ